MPSTNIFEVLALSRTEDPHDRILAWLCDPSEGHGIKDFAHEMIRLLWGQPVNESISFVKRQYQLGADSYPDVVVQFDFAFLVIENKVRASALRDGQLERQNSLAREKQAGKPLFHVLLCPDHFRTDGFGPTGNDFRTLKYGDFARLVRTASEKIENSQLAFMLRDYALHIENAFGRIVTSGIKLASARFIARRNNSQTSWSEEQFLQQSCDAFPTVADAQRELIELLHSMESVEARFDSVGQTNATYKVYLSGTSYHPLWVYSDGRLYVNWDLGLQTAAHNTASVCQTIWGGLVKSSNKGGSFVTGGLAALGPTEIARKLQRLADEVSMPADSDSGSMP